MNRFGVPISGFSPQQRPSQRRRGGGRATPSLPSRASQRGFSLLEVLVAFAILALSLGVLTQVFSSAMRNTQISSRYSEAMMVAEGRIASASVVEDLKEGSESGEVGDFRWTTAIAPYDIGEIASNPALQLLRIQVMVAWEDYGKPRTLELVTLRVGVEGI